MTGGIARVRVQKISGHHKGIRSLDPMAVVAELPEINREGSRGPGRGKGLRGGGRGSSASPNVIARLRLTSGPHPCITANLVLFQSPPCASALPSPLL